MSVPETSSSSTTALIVSPASSSSSNFIPEVSLSPAHAKILGEIRQRFKSSQSLHDLNLIRPYEPVHVPDDSFSNCISLLLFRIRKGYATQLELSIIEDFRSKVLLTQTNPSTTSLVPIPSQSSTINRFSYVFVPESDLNPDNAAKLLSMRMKCQIFSASSEEQNFVSLYEPFIDRSTDESLASSVLTLSKFKYKRGYSTIAENSIVHASEPVWTGKDNYAKNLKAMRYRSREGYAPLDQERHVAKKLISSNASRVIYTHLPPEERTEHQTEQYDRMLENAIQSGRPRKAMEKEARRLNSEGRLMTAVQEHYINERYTREKRDFSAFGVEATRAWYANEPLTSKQTAYLEYHRECNRKKNENEKKQRAQRSLASQSLMFGLTFSTPSPSQREKVIVNNVAALQPLLLNNDFAAYLGGINVAAIRFLEPRADVIKMLETEPLEQESKSLHQGGRGGLTKVYLLSDSDGNYFNARTVRNAQVINVVLDISANPYPFFIEHTLQVLQRKFNKNNRLAIINGGDRPSCQLPTRDGFLGVTCITFVKRSNCFIEKNGSIEPCTTTPPFSLGPVAPVLPELEEIDFHASLSPSCNLGDMVDKIRRDLLKLPKDSRVFLPIQPNHLLTPWRKIIPGSFFYTGIRFDADIVNMLDLLGCDIAVDLEHSSVLVVSAGMISGSAHSSTTFKEAIEEGKEIVSFDDFKKHLNEAIEALNNDEEGLNVYLDETDNEE